jgi:hypothetical protein
MPFDEEDSHDECAAEIKNLRMENERMRSLLNGISAALKARGLFAFEHIDCTLTINDR